MPQGKRLRLASGTCRPVAIAPEMTDAIDDTSRPERNPGNLYRQNHQAGNDAEQRDVVVFQKDPVGKIAAMVTSTASANRSFLKNSQSRCGLSRIPHIRAATLRCFSDVLAGSRRDARKVS